MFLEISKPRTTTWRSTVYDTLLTNSKPLPYSILLNPTELHTTWLEMEAYLGLESLSGTFTLLFERVQLKSFAIQVLYTLQPLDRIYVQKSVKGLY